MNHFHRYDSDILANYFALQLQDHQVHVVIGVLTERNVNTYTELELTQIFHNES